jgi:hypothetical protein
MMQKQLQAIAKDGTLVVTIDDSAIRKIMRSSKTSAQGAVLFRRQGEPAPEIVRTLYKAGASFDAASLPSPWR